MKIYLIRHGKTASNILQAYNGRNDEPLSEEGRKELESRKYLYDNVVFDYVYSSPMTRVRQTLQILFDDIKVDQIRDDLMEMDFGSWVGVKYVDKYNELKNLGYSINDLVDPEGGETFASLFHRTNSLIDEIIETQSKDATVLVASHGMVIASIVKQRYYQDEIYWNLAPDNGLGYIIDTNTNTIEKIEL